MARSARLLVTAGLAVSLVVVTGATSSAWASTNTRQATTNVASPTLTSANFSFSLSLGWGTPVNLTGSGQIDFANDALAMSITLPSNLAGLLGGGSVNAVISKGALYLETPRLGGSVTKPWVFVPLPSGSIVGLFNTIGTALGNVSQLTSFASSHGASVSPLPSSTVDNTTVTGYLISAGSSVFSAKFTLWANSQNEVVQTILQMGSPSGGPSTSIEFDLSGYNAPITFSAPPPSQVTGIPIPQQLSGGVVGTAKPVKKLVGFADSHLVKKGHHRRHGG